MVPEHVGVWGVSRVNLVPEGECELSIQRVIALAVVANEDGGDDEIAGVLIGDAGSGCYLADTLISIGYGLNDEVPPEVVAYAHGIDGMTHAPHA